MPKTKNLSAGVSRALQYMVKKELSTEEYLEFIRAIVPKFPEDSTKLLRELTKDLSIDEVFEEVLKRERRTA